MPRRKSGASAGRVPPHAEIEMPVRLDHRHRRRTLCASALEEAAHSRSADMLISREMMMMTGYTISVMEMSAGGLLASRMSAADTLKVSQANTRRRPNEEKWGARPNLRKGGVD